MITSPLFSGICIIAGLLLVHSKFDFKSDYDQLKSMMTRGGGIGMGPQSGTGTIQGGNNMGGGAASRKRRDDNSASGYGNQYNSGGPGAGGMMAMSTTILQQVAPMIAGIELEESIGSPLVFAGLSIGSLLIAVLLSVGEYCLVKRASEYGDSSVKYENVTLT